ncbi:MAG: hypothetical protein UV67_C0002G0001 [Parcubacteria group bacterium GW2011_GWC1_43_12]|nr:MAG: hypothetical protein UV67_C0002G0001 [Parcubacteria group bacterium GW2011_GWC1_43_12]
MILKNNYSRGELAKEILKGLAVGGIIVVSLILPNLPQILKMFQAGKAKDRARIKRTVNALRRKKLVKFFRKNGQAVIRITEKGKRKVQEYSFENMKISRPKKWDGLWRLIIFDIPESHKQGRDALNKSLKNLSLYPLQRSVFIYPFQCRNEIDFICDFFDIEQFVDYLIVKDIGKDREEEMKTLFNLK